MTKRIISIYILTAILVTSIPTLNIKAETLEESISVSENDVEPLSCESTDEEGTEEYSISENDLTDYSIEEDDTTFEVQEFEDIFCAESQVSSLPASYDGRDYGYVSALKKQKDNYCWAFSSIAAMESNLLKKGYSNIDLSEKKMIYFNQGSIYDPLGNASANYRTAAATTLSSDMAMNGYVTNGIGLVSEKSTESYSAQYIPQSLAYQREYVPLNIETTPYTAANMDKIKENIMKYGGGAIDIPFNNETIITYAGKNNMPEANLYTTGKGSISHLIELIGWDDAYLASNFTPAASRNGAWLAKDPNGFFVWIPYCDMDNTEVADRNVVFYDMSANFYENNYHYGNGGESAIIKSASTPGTVSYLTMFTSRAVSTENIKAITAGFENKNSSIGKCIITLYKNPVMSNGVITSYEDAKAYSYEPPFSGIHTIMLPTPFTISTGDLFAIQIDVPHTTGVYHEYYDSSSNNGYTYHLDPSNRKNFYKAAEATGYTDYKDIATKTNTILSVKVLTDGAISQMEAPAQIDNNKIKAEAPFEEVLAIEQEMDNELKDGKSLEKTTFTKEGITYQIIKDFDLDENGKIMAIYLATVINGKNINKTKVSIPDKVKYNGTVYKVVSISKNAFSGNKKIKSIKLGKNIETIEKNAFKNCKKLKKITVSSGKLNKVASSAFKKTGKNKTVKYPKRYKKKYAKMFRKVL